MYCSQPVLKNSPTCTKTVCFFRSLLFSKYYFDCAMLLTVERALAMQSLTETPSKEAPIKSMPKRFCWMYSRILATLLLWPTTYCGIHFSNL